MTETKETIFVKCSDSALVPGAKIHELGEIIGGLAVQLAALRQIIAVCERRKHSMSPELMEVLVAVAAIDPTRGVRAEPAKTFTLDCVQMNSSGRALVNGKLINLNDGDRLSLGADGQVLINGVEPPEVSPDE